MGYPLIMLGKFRPQHFNPLFNLRSLYKVGRYNWILRAEWTLNSYLIKVHSQLHYRSSHAPCAVRKKWRKVTDIFEKKHHKII